MSKFSTTPVSCAVVFCCAFLLLIFSGCAALPAAKVQLESVVLAGQVVEKAGTERWGPGKITDRFGPEDNIYVFATFVWPDAGQGQGVHEHTARWHTGNDVVSETKTRNDFSEAPFEVLSWLPASSLGNGSHSVEILIDGKSLSRKSFVVEEK